MTNPSSPPPATDGVAERVQRALGHAYRIDREIGGGGMSRVFLAHEGSLARDVVVKVLRPDIRVRIERDIALLRGIGELVDRVHPNADKIRPLDVVAELELTLRNANELDYVLTGNDHSGSLLGKLLAGRTA